MIIGNSVVCIYSMMAEPKFNVNDKIGVAVV
jgi:hypothetical protein